MKYATNLGRKLGTIVVDLGHRFVFSPTTISIDGVAVGPLIPTVTDLRIDAGYWPASLRVNAREVQIRR